MLQAIRFGTFTPVQQERLNALTGNKPLKDAVMDALQITGSAKIQRFNAAIQEEVRSWSEELQPLTTDTLDETYTEEMEDILQGEALMDVAKEMEGATPAEKRGLLLSWIAPFVIGLTEAAENWAHTPSDKAFDTLVKLVTFLKEQVKF